MIEHERSAKVDITLGKDYVYKAALQEVVDSYDAYRNQVPGLPATIARYREAMAQAKRLLEKGK